MQQWSIDGSHLLNQESLQGPAFPRDQSEFSAQNSGGVWPDNDNAESITIKQLITVTPASWKGQPVVEERWLVLNRLPGDDLSILTGDGGTGKTEIALQLCVQVAMGLRNWLGYVVDAGAALFFSAEEPEDRLRKRVSRICSSQGINPDNINNLHLHFPDLEETALASMGRTGQLERTRLLDSLEKTISVIKPRLVIIDNVAAAFDGEAIARRQVRRFCAMLRGIARKHSTAIVLLDHPSIRGMSDHSGTAGSVDWRNSARAMMYLTTVRGEPDERTLEITKNNDGQAGEKIRLRWNGTTFATAAMAGPSPARAKVEREIEELFLKLLDKRNVQGRPVHSKSAGGSAPSVFAKDPDAGGVTADAFRKAMERLFTAGTIVKVDFGPPSKKRERIERAGG